jgi:hypothetical protein
MNLCIQDSMPRNTVPACRPQSDQKAKILEKLIKVLERGYIQVPRLPAFVKSLVDYFPVIKGNDVRFVYNGTSCRLNAALWAPSFWLPTPKLAARVLS